MLVAHLAQPPTRAEQRALSDSLTCRLFADEGQLVAADDIGRTIYGKPQLRDSPPVSYTHLTLPTICSV